MVSFFGIKFGDKKNKSAQAKQPQEWKRIDQNALGEGQFFGKNLDKGTVVNGSIRSMSRANTAMSIRSPYVHDTHNLAASSMFDLSNVSHSRNGSQTSMNLKPHASDAGLRTRFGANNASSHSLAVPGPGFGSRPVTPGGKAKPWVNPLDVHFARSSPTVPPPQKSPLAQIEVQSIAPSEKEGDAGSVFGEDADDMVEAIMASAKKKDEEEKAAKEKELELERQKETARLEMERLERQKSTETNSPKTAKPPQPQQQREESKQRQQHQQKREDLPQQQNPLDGIGGLGAGPGPVFRGNMDQRPGSRNGGMRGNEPNGPNGPSRPFPGPHSAHQGPPRHAPPTQSLPSPPQNGGSRNHHQGGPPQNPAARHPRPNGPGPRPLDLASNAGRPYSPGPNSPAFRSPTPNEYRSQSPAQGGPGGNRPRGPGGSGLVPNEFRSQSPAMGGPSGNRVRGPSGNGPTPNESRSQSPAMGGLGGFRPHAPGVHGLNHQIGGSLRERAPEGPSPLLLRRADTAPLTMSRSFDNGPIEQFARPIIQNVAAKRDTLQMLTPRRHSLSMKIEELEKTLIEAQVKTHELERRRVSSGSSNYSASVNSDVSSLSDNDEPILGTSIQPAPLRTAALSPTPHAAPAPSPAPSPAPTASTPSPTEGGRWQQPQNFARGPVMRGPPPRRPTLDEYGVTAVNRKTSNSSNSRLAQAPLRSASGQSSNPRPSESDESAPLELLQKVPSSRSNTPQFRQHQRPQQQPQPNPTHDESPVVPVPAERASPEPIIPALSGFKFDFGTTTTSTITSIAAPPTPDSTTWPLASASPTHETMAPSPAHSPPSSSTLNRPNAPPPLNFNFSPDAPTREQGPWTPPLRSVSKKMFNLDDQGERPSTATGFSSSSLAPAPSFARSRTPVDDAAMLGIGVARGLSIRETPAAKRERDQGGSGGAPPRPPPPQVGVYEFEPPRTPVDKFGTGFI